MHDLLSQLAAALLVVGGTVVLGLVHLIARPGSRLSVFWTALGLGGTAVALVCTQAPWPAWQALGLLAVLGFGGPLLLSPRAAVVYAAVFRALRRPRTQGALLLALAPLLGLAWLGQLSTALPDDPPEDPRVAKLAQVLKVRPQPALAFYTDRGRRVPAYQPAPGQLTPAELPDLEALLLRRGEMQTNLVRLAGPDLSSNCHGWTFTGGRCWIRTEEAEGILRDNGYQAVSAPRSGDLVAYRQENGTLAHSGVVTAVLNDGTVLVESKWGWAGRYVHPVAAQQYADRWEYLRSERDGHWLCAAPDPRSVSGTVTE
jgi:hypothetical protein